MLHFNKKKILVIAIGINLMSCGLLAGVIYPKVIFSFSLTGDAPPGSADERLKFGNKYPQAITFFFSQGGNNFNAEFIPTFFVSKPYRTLFLNEMSYEWDNGKGIFLTNKEYRLSNKYITNNDWYWMRGGIGESFFVVNFEKIFRNKKPGDKFYFKLKLRYSFDNEPEQTQILNYSVTAVKGRYIYPFAF